MRFSMIATALVASVFSVGLQAAPSDEIRERLLQAVPGAKVVSISPSALPGIYEVLLEGQVIYASADGKLVLQGELLALDGKTVTNLSDQAMAKRREVVLAAIDRRQAIIFAPKGKSKAVITVFTDTDCGYCRKLHQEVPALNALGVEVRYLAYPRSFPQSGAKGGTAAVMSGIWCSTDTKATLTAVKAGENVTPPQRKGCVSPVADQFALGAKIGVQGTPAIFNAKGEQLGGYVTAAELKKRLGL
mgnify:CR=1 FL=1